MIHPDCAVAAKRIADARAAIAVLPTVHSWQREAMLYELDLITHKLADISEDLHALETA